MITKNKSSSIALTVFFAITFFVRIVLISLAITDSTPDSLIEKSFSISVSFSFLVSFIIDLLLKGKRSSAKRIAIVALCALAFAVSIIYTKLALDFCGDKYIVDAYSTIILSLLIIACVAVYCIKEFSTYKNRNTVIITSSALPFIVSVTLILTSLTFAKYSFIDLLFLIVVTLTTIFLIIDSIVWVVKRKKLSE